MTEINISRERVEKLAKHIERALSEGGKGSAGNPEDVVASTLRALRTALDEAMRGALERAEKQFRWYADEHTKAGKVEKAKTNTDMAEMCAAALQNMES